LWPHTTSLHHDEEIVSNSAVFGQCDEMTDSITKSQTDTAHTRKHNDAGAYLGSGKIKLIQNVPTSARNKQKPRNLKPIRKKFKNPKTLTNLFFLYDKQNCLLPSLESLPVNRERIKRTFSS